MFTIETRLSIMEDTMNNIMKDYASYKNKCTELEDKYIMLEQKYNKLLQKFNEVTYPDLRDDYVDDEYEPNYFSD